jgi:hypothetical protein
MQSDDKTTMPRCGDHVRHRPTGERWLVAWAEGDELAPAGWPTSMARLADCEVIHRCSDMEHAAAVREWGSSQGGHRTRVLRLYGEALTNA